MQTAVKTPSFGVSPLALVLALITVVSIVFGYVWSGAFDGLRRIVLDQASLDVTKIEQDVLAHPQALPTVFKPSSANGLSFTWYRDSTAPVAYKVALSPVMCQKLQTQVNPALEDWSFECVTKVDKNGQTWGLLRGPQKPASA